MKRNKTPAPPPGETWYDVATQLDAEIAEKDQELNDLRAEFKNSRELHAKEITELNGRLAEARRRTIRDIHGAFDLNFDPIAVLSYSIDPEINYIGNQWPPAMVASTRVKIVVLADAHSVTIDRLKKEMEPPTNQAPPSTRAKEALKTIARIAEENSK